MRQMYHVSQVVSRPGRRESESVLVTLGLDVVQTRVRPSKSFDELSDDFNKLQLVCTISGLLFGLLYVQKLVRASLHVQMFKLRLTRFFPAAGPVAPDEAQVVQGVDTVCNRKRKTLAR